jgi:protein-tyrosine phosphatase
MGGFRHHHEHMAEISTYRVCFVCSGNICRSPMAEAVMRELSAQAGLQVEADSAGTGDWHMGERADLRALRALGDAGYPPLAHRARQFSTEWFAGRDLIVGLDAGHLRTLRSLAPNDEAQARIRLLRSFDPALGADVTGRDGDIADPYYDGDRAFNDVLRQIETACAGLVSAIAADQAPRLPAAITLDPLTAANSTV